MSQQTVKVMYQAEMLNIISISAPPIKENALILDLTLMLISFNHIILHPSGSFTIQNLV